jgi:predicted nucleic-acid-binding protein
MNVIRSRTPSDPGWVCLPVLAEVLWVLAKTYKQKQPSIVQVVEGLLASQDIIVEREDIVAHALNLYRRGDADFANCLIAVLANSAGCERTVTFDKIAARDAGMELIS